MGALRPHQSSGDHEDHESPEALLISAFLETGAFEAEKHHIEPDDIESWRQLWDFCMDYQDKAGHAPPMSLVSKRHPDFSLIPDISVEWAASEVRKVAAERRLRHAGAAMAAALRDGDLEGAFDAVTDIRKPRGFTKEPASIFDHAVMEQHFDVGHIEVPWPTLNRATNGGIRNGELWWIAARFGQRKTFSLLNMAARAADVGCRVGIASLEMPAGDIAARTLRYLAGRDAEILKHLDSDDVFERKKAQDELLERTPGSISVYDPSHGMINTVEHIREMCMDYDVVFLDHVGLMRNKDGKRAIDDWRVQATISNQLREVTLSTMTSVVGAAQINREGDNPGSAAPPKAKNLAQSDALGQDADVIVTQKGLSKRVTVHSAEKVRNAEGLKKWYSRFDPAKNRFEEIDYDKALELMAVDGDL